MKLARTSLLTALLILFVDSVGAEEALGEILAPSHSLDVTLSGADDDADAAERALTELLTNLPLQLEFSRQRSFDPQRLIGDELPGSTTSLGHLWLELGLQGRCSIFVIDARRESAMVRRVACEEGIDVVVIEELAQIAASAMEVLLAGARLESSPEELLTLLAPPARLEEPALEEVHTEDPGPVNRAPRVEAPDRGPSSPPVVLELGIGYFVEPWLRSSAPFHGPRAGAALVFSRARLDPSLALELAYGIPILVEGQEIAARYQLFRLGLLLKFTALERGRLSLRAHLGVLVDLTQIEPRQRGDSGISLEERSLRPIVLISLGVELSVRVYRSLFLRFGVGLNIDALGARYVLESEESTSVVFEPWMLRPSFWIDLGGPVTQ